ncbi:MAG: DUF1449 family protein [Fimbriimonas sp.]|nr:DUF1449 family protein [Fimbriimonas sp.]
MIADFFTAKENTAFVVALVVLTVLSLLIVTATLLGAIHLPEADADLEVDWDSDGLLNGLLEFFGVSAMPLSIFVLVATCSFFVTGYVIQMLALGTGGAFLPGWVAIAPAIAVSLGCCRLVGKGFAKTKFKLHTTAVASSSFLYRLVTIQSGVAKVGLSAEAKLVDDHGQTHYVLVEPKNPGESFPQGSEVILVEQVGSRFLAVSGNVEDILNNDN